MNRWKTHFPDMLNKEEDKETEPQTSEDGQMEAPASEMEDDTSIPPPAYNEVIEAIKELKNNKAPGKDTTSELIKAAGVDCQTRLANLILKI